MNKVEKIFLSILLMVLHISISGCGDGGKNRSPKLGGKGTKSAKDQALEKERSQRILRLKKIKEEAKKRFDLEMEKAPEFNEEEAKRQLFLEKYDIDLNKIPRERKSIAEIIELIHKEAQEAANLEFTDMKRQKIIEEAEKEFPLYKVGALVEVKTIRGAIYGMLERIYPDKIKVEKYYILLDDIISPAPECFNKLKCQKRRDHFARINFDILKDDFKIKCVKEFTPRIYKEEGFLMIKNQWVPVEDLMKNKIGPVVLKMKTSYYANLERKIKERVEQQMSKEESLPIN